MGFPLPQAKRTRRLGSFVSERSVFFCAGHESEVVPSPGTRSMAESLVMRRMLTVPFLAGTLGRKDLPGFGNEPFRASRHPSF